MWKHVKTAFKSAKTVLKKVFKWILLNLPQILLICGFCLVTIGFFLLLIPAGYMAAGLSLIILAILSYKSE